MKKLIITMLFLVCFVPAICFAIDSDESAFKELSNTAASIKKAIGEKGSVDAINKHIKSLWIFNNRIKSICDDIYAQKALDEANYVSFKQESNSRIELNKARLDNARAMGNITQREYIDGDYKVRKEENDKDIAIARLELEKATAAIGKSTCADYRDNGRKITAEMMFISAEYFATKNNIKAARQIYRDVITTFVGDAYRSYVKRAEFALEDLKAMPENKTTSKKKK